MLGGEFLPPPTRPSAERAPRSIKWGEGPRKRHVGPDAGGGFYCREKGRFLLPNALGYDAESGTRVLKENKFAKKKSLNQMKTSKTNSTFPVFC